MPHTSKILHNCLSPIGHPKKIFFSFFKAQCVYIYTLLMLSHVLHLLSWFWLSYIFCNALFNVDFPKDNNTILFLYHVLCFVIPRCCVIFLYHSIFCISYRALLLHKGYNLSSLFLLPCFSNQLLRSINKSFCIPFFKVLPSRWTSVLCGLNCIAGQWFFYEWPYS